MVGGTIKLVRRTRGEVWKEENLTCCISDVGSIQVEKSFSLELKRDLTTDSRESCVTDAVMQGMWRRMGGAGRHACRRWHIQQPGDHVKIMREMT